MRLRHSFAIIVLIFMCRSISAQDFSGDTTSGCSPHSVKFALDDTTTLTSVLWDFGNGVTSTLFNPPRIVYPDPGRYTVSAIIDGNAASPIVKIDYITVIETLAADFRIDSLDVLTYSFVPTETIIDLNADFSFRWEYSWTDTIVNNTIFVYDADITKAIDTYTFPDTGSYRISLTTRNFSGCIDSTFQILVITPSTDTTSNEKYKPGNVFSPNSPGGEFYIIDPMDPAIVLFFEVFSRTGVSVFKTESPVIYWDGRTNYGTDLGTGVYFYVLKATQGDPTEHYSTSGFIHLFR